MSITFFRSGANDSQTQQQEGGHLPAAEHQPEEDANAMEQQLMR